MAAQPGTHRDNDLDAEWEMSFSEPPEIARGVV